MRDGVKLHTDIDFPLFKSPADGPYKTIIDRSPYGEFAIELLALAYGLIFEFASVRQDMRGTKQSQGNFSIWKTSANDSFDTFTYIQHQNWSDGTIFEIGASADGLAAFTSVLGHPPGLSAQFIIFASAVGWPTVFVNGGWRESLTQLWMESTVPDQAPALIAEVMAHEAPDGWWDALDLRHHWGDVKWPAVMWGGWYDIFLNGQLIGFDGYHQHADPSVRDQMHLVIDPLGHCQSGSKYFPRNLIFGRVLLPILQSAALYKGEAYPEDCKAITFYVMGPDDDSAVGNYWTTLDNWPERTVTPYYFRAGGGLSTVASASTANSTSFKYDPSNPVPSMGGNNLKIKCGPLE
jgi:hypothetical protein